MKLFLLIVVSLVILVCGMSSDLHLGDEIVHYRLARTIYQTHQWPLYDTMNQSYGNQRFYFADQMLWHTLLAGFWALTGGISRFSAQVYQVFFFFVLIIATYVFTAQKYSHELAVASAFLLATVPVITALSVILHTDVPVVAVLMASLAFLVKKEYVLAGILAGCAILMKRTAYLFLPAFLMFGFLEPGGGLRDKFFSTVRFFVPFLLVASFGVLQAFIIDRVIASTLKTTDMLYLFSGTLSLPLKDMFTLRENIAKIPLLSGIVILVSLILYGGKRAFSKKDIPILLAAGSIIFLACIRFGWSISTRYLIGAIPFIAIIAARGFLAIRSPRLKGFLIIAGACQFLCAAVFTTCQRIVPENTKRFYESVRRITPEGARIMSSRPDPQFYADRRTIWNNYLSMKEMPYFFWMADDQAIRAILDKYDIDYLLVEKDRIYDDATEKHQLGWPLSFVKRLPSCPNFRNVMANDQLILYQVVK